MSYGEGRRVRFRWADGIALLLAIALFLGALGFHWYSNRAPVEQTELVCLLLISGMEQRDWETYGDQWMQSGSPLRSSNGTVVLGTLETVTEREHLQALVRDGVPAWEAHPFFVDLEIEVRMSASYEIGDGLRVGDLRIAAGGRGDFYFGNLLAAAQILEVREVQTA